jgi:hypothetical protein
VKVIRSAIRTGRLHPPGNIPGRVRLKRDGTGAETRFRFRRNGQVHLNRRGRQFSRLLTAEVCALVGIMLDTPRSEVVREYWLPIPFASFPFTSPPVRHRVPSGFKRTLLMSVRG